MSSQSDRLQDISLTLAQACGILELLSFHEGNNPEGNHDLSNALGGIAALITSARCEINSCAVFAMNEQ